MEFFGVSAGVSPKNSMINCAICPGVRDVRHNGDVIRVPDEDRVAAALRSAGARFAFVHGSRADGQGVRDDSDLDVAGWWGGATRHRKLGRSVSRTASTW